MNRHVLTLTTILFCLFQLCIAGEGFWETHGPYGGRIWEVEYSGGTRGLCYAGGQGGIFTSFDDGVTWENRTPDQPLEPSDTYCFHLSACPAQVGLVYAVFGDRYGDYYSAVLKSTDAGATWEELPSPGQTDWISAIACDPNDPNRVYVAYSEGEVFRSLDGGSSWEFIFGAVVLDICAAPSDSNVVWMSCYPEGPMRSRDGGTTWEMLANGLGAQVTDAGNICISPADSNDVLLCADRLFRWNASESFWELFGMPAYDVVFAPTDPSRIYVCDYSCVYFSDDGGESWKVCQTVQPGSSIAASYYDSNDVIMAASYSGVWRSDDGCKTLSFSSDGISGKYVNDLLACDAEMQVLVCYGPDFICRSIDGGAWTRSVGFPYGEYYLSCIAQDPSDARVLYLAEGYLWMLYASDDAGETWHSIANLPWEIYYVNSITVDPTNPKRIYLAVDHHGVAYRSEDGGLTWQTLDLHSGGASYYAEAYFVRIDPSDSARIFVGTSDGLYLSQNDGESFERVANLRSFTPDFMEFHPWDSQTMYCGRSTTDGADRPALCVSTDGGGTWAPIDTPVTAVCAMAINPDDGDEFYIAGDCSLHHTIDAGEVWLPLAADGFDCPVSTAVLVDFGEAGNRIYATGYGVFSFFDVGTPFISLSLSQPVYAAGDMFHLSCDITNPGASSNVDLIVWIELPGGTNVYLPGLGLTRAPFYSGWLPGHLSLKDYTLLEARVDAGLPLGDYTVFAALYEQGADEQLSNIAAETFTMASGIE